MIDIRTRIKVTSLLKSGKFFKELVDIMQAGSGLFVAAMKREMPVDRGTGRNSVETTTRNSGNRAGFSVAPTAKSQGRPYLLYLHGGTYNMKGKPDYGYTPGRVRSGTVAKGIGGVRPNKFADRAEEKTMPRFRQFVFNQLIALSKQ